MAISRYKDTDVIFNGDPDFKQVFKKRFARENLNEVQRVEILKHLETLELNYPDLTQFMNLSTSEYTWAPGDRFYKVAHKFYGDPGYWWVIAFFNKKPTDHHVKPGELIKVPTQLTEVLKIFGL